MRARDWKSIEGSSSEGNKVKAKRTIEALGLKRMHHTVVHNDTPEIRGMVFKVKHMVQVEEVEE